jgi:hypothetical protein
VAGGQFLSIAGATVQSYIASFDTTSGELEDWDPKLRSAWGSCPRRASMARYLPPTATGAATVEASSSASDLA